MNVYYNGLYCTDFSDVVYIPSKLDRKLDEVLEHGFNVIFLFVANSWFNFGAKSYREHRSDVPDLRTFQKLIWTITNFITMDLSSFPTPLPAIAVDAKKEYLEIDMGTLDPYNSILELPYISDWAIAIGNF